ncbi:hypothetical protein [Alicyclobacillus shizuokensis]|nr:hypothetical protein [Alicyclobacillus shizuokensis]MCL6625868.1 hypothetical protein [Alicyclobacillus shizuokensis]
MLEVVLVTAAFLGLVYILSPSKPVTQRTASKRARAAALHARMRSARPR